MASDKHNQYSEDASSQTTYPSEYKENVQNPGTSLSYPVVGPKELIPVTQAKIDRVFFYLFFTSLACTGAVMLVPNQIVEAVVGTIWISSIGLARFLLGSAYHRKEYNRRT